jgi:hypothetical protein
VAAKRRKLGEAHVRVYSHEMRTEAWQTMSPTAKALLVEMRALYNGKGNRVFMSVREMRRRLGVGQLKAEKARGELLERGWIRVIEEGSFSRKVRHATVYALEHEPLEDRDGAVAPKSYMRWSQKNTVLVVSTDGTDSEYRGTCHRRCKNDPLTPR